MKRPALLVALILISVRAFAAEELRDVKSPVDLPGFPWGAALATVLGLAALAGVVWAFNRWRRRKPAVIKSAWEVAYERLAELEGRKLLAEGRLKDYYSDLSDIIRRYIEDRFNIHAPEMTTEEFLASLKANALIGQSHKDILKRFLVLCDMVKFAKYGANTTEAEESFGLVKRFIDETRGDLTLTS